MSENTAKTTDPIWDSRNADDVTLQENYSQAIEGLKRELAEVQQRLIAFTDSPEGKNFFAAQQRDTANRLVDELERELATAEAKLRSIKQFLKNAADTNADNMEGANLDEFKAYEACMVLAVESLKQLGVKYNPITGVEK